MKFSLVICFKQSGVLLCVSQWKLHAEELYFPVPWGRWQRQCEMLLGMPAFLGGFFCRSTAFFGVESALARPAHPRHPGLMLWGITFSAWILALRLWVLVAFWEWVPELSSHSSSGVVYVGNCVGVMESLSAKEFLAHDLKVGLAGRWPAPAPLKWLCKCCLNAAPFLCVQHISKEMKLRLILLISLGVSWP